MEGEIIQLVFFTRGIRHRDERTRNRWQNGVEPVSPLELTPDPDNDYDPNALRIVDADGWDMGYLPWYYTSSFSKLIEANSSYEIAVRRQNPEPSYPQHRFLLEFRGDRPSGWRFPQSPLYDQITNTDHEEARKQGVA